MTVSGTVMRRMPRCVRASKKSGLRRIGLGEAGVRLRQVETKHTQLHAHAADDADAFAEIDLRMARRMGQRHEGLARPGAGDPNVILHDRIAAGVAAAAVRKCVPLLRRCLVGILGWLGLSPTPPRLF
jgi:hypothetical protein